MSEPEGRATRHVEIAEVMRVNAPRLLELGLITDKDWTAYGSRVEMTLMGRGLLDSPPRPTHEWEVLDEELEQLRAVEQAAMKLMALTERVEGMAPRPSTTLVATSEDSDWFIRGSALKPLRLALDNYAHWDASHPARAALLSQPDRAEPPVLPPPDPSLMDTLTEGADPDRYARLRDSQPDRGEGAE